VQDADDVLPTALDCKKISAEAEAKKAADYLRAREAAENEKKDLVDRLLKPSGVDDQERMKRAAAIIRRAVSNGLVEVEVFRFSHKLCTDGGRAINQQEPGWEDTLTGLPKELFLFWKAHLAPRGYRVKFQIADWPGGMPGDVSMTLAWG
jgi:hypothetical protein